MLSSRAQKLILAGAVMVSASAVCGCDRDRLADANPYRPYDDGAVTVIGGDPNAPVASGQVGDNQCLQVTVDTCVPVDRSGQYCKSDTGPVDQVQINGTTALTICYSDTAQKGSLKVLDGGDGNVDVPQQQNGSVITFDPSSDGKAIKGDITIDANDVTLYGNGPDKSIIDGNLTLIGNNARIRGIRIKGNVRIMLNTAALILSVVEGNLEIGANNVLVAETQVFGNFQVSGNNAILAGNGTGGQWMITGSGAQCERNYAFRDQNNDLKVADTERGAALACQ